MRSAFFGGSFDPFHDGHLAIVNALRERDLCDEIWIVPARLSPGKTAPRASGPHRLAMAALAVSGLPDVLVSDLDLKRVGPSYTVDSLETMTALRPDAEPVLVLGADAWRDFGTWRRPGRILELAEIVVVARGDVADLPDRPGARLHVLDDFDVPVASTDLRARLDRGEGVEGAVPPAVAEYIRRHGLYGDSTAITGDGGTP